MAAKERLDQLLVQRGLFSSREKAQRSILAGQIWVEGQRVDKAGTKVAIEAALECRGNDRYVGRGGHKLEAALKHFGFSPEGKECLDLGASTGGFTDCLLQHGATRVVALDVGHGQLDWKLRQDSRVEVLEKVNARHLTLADFGRSFPVIVTDVSFISLKLILPAAFGLLAESGWIAALIKPQFEAGREEVNRGSGVIRDPEIRERIVCELREWVKGYPVKDLGVTPSPITGADGNQEYLWGLSRE